MRNVFARELLQIGKQDSRIVLITGDLGFGVWDEFESELPDQFINAGVSEQSMISMAAGIASEGRRVFVYSIGNFPTFRALEQIRNDVCYMDNAVTIVSVGAGFSYGPQGYTHHALEDVAVMRALPKMEVYVPSDNFETSQLTKLIAGKWVPSYLRLGSFEGKVGGTVVDDSAGFTRVIRGADGHIVFSGAIGSEVLEAVRILNAGGLRPSIYSVWRLSPLNKDLLNMFHGSKVLSVEEHSVRGGLGSAILEKLSELRISASVRLLGTSDSNLARVGSAHYLRASSGLSAIDIAREFTSLMEEVRTI
jgi:transketolase